CLTGTFAYW
nr:immunoglobulin heavy chain junction region [Mus musculus]MBK4190148.1 immunoglobulin heavy chain junction region [Mus musculus]